MTGIHIFLAVAALAVTPTLENDMSFHREHFEELIRETLDEHELNSESAVALLLGTAAVESAFGTYLKQLHRGPALGVMQMEPATYRWLQTKYEGRIAYGCRFTAQGPEAMVGDLKLAIIMARLRYLVVPEPLPPADDVDALGRYWKSYFNTFAGAGSLRGWTEAWEKYVAD